MNTLVYISNSSFKYYSYRGNTSWCKYRKSQAKKSIPGLNSYCSVITLTQLHGNTRNHFLFIWVWICLITGGHS